MSEDKSRTREIDLEYMNKTTKAAYDFMFKLLCHSSEEKLLHLYLLTCKIELFINFLLKSFKNDIYSPTSQRDPQKQSAQAPHSHSYMKSLIIHTHQSILYFLELSTILMAKNPSIQEISQKTPQIRANIETARDAIISLCKNKQTPFFDELASLASRELSVEQSSLPTDYRLRDFERQIEHIQAR